MNAVGSLIALARTTKAGVYCYCNAGRENAVASTKAFTTQVTVTVLALIALWFRQARDKIEGHPPSIEATKLKEALVPHAIAHYFWYGIENNSVKRWLKNSTPKNIALFWVKGTANRLPWKVL